MRIKASFAVACLAVVAFSGQARGFEEWPTSKPYTAGAVGVDVDLGVASVNQAGGAVDCASGNGGACFDTEGHRGFFTVEAVDDVSGSVGIFMGFDMDGDGCVGCTGPADVFFQGTDHVTGFIPFQQGVPNEPLTLFVFVRAATLNALDFGTTGELTIAAGCDESPTGECSPDFADDSGTFCVERDPTANPEQPCHHVPYPYPGIGD